MVSARIDLQGLNEELQSFSGKFNAWAQQSVSNAEAEKDKHLRHLRELQSTFGFAPAFCFSSTQLPIVVSHNPPRASLSLHFYSLPCSCHSQHTTIAERSRKEGLGSTTTYVCFFLLSTFATTTAASTTTITHTHMHAGLNDEKEQIADLEAELAKVQAEQAALPSLVAEVQVALEQETSSAAADAADLNAREKSQQKVLSGIEGALNMYKNRLGLSFAKNKTTGAMEAVFSQLDPTSPSRQFTVAFKISSDNRYAVTGCDPPLSNIQLLTDELNATDNFREFIKAVRTSFQQEYVVAVAPKSE